MIIYKDTSTTPASLKEVIDTALAAGNVGSLLILSCDGNDFTPERLDPVLRAVPVPVFGGTFPMVMCAGEQMLRGSVIVAMERTPDVYYVDNLSDPEVDFEEFLDRTVGECGDMKTLMVFVDGLSKRIASFIDALYAIFGLEMNYVGGGAGSLAFRQKPCLITNDGLKEDGGVLVGFDMESGVGVGHGWSAISGPYKVTEADHNVVRSLEWRPAFDVYKGVVEAHSGLSFTSVPFFDIAKAYPFGIAKMVSELIVRDPVAVDGEYNLVCVGEVPTGSYVDILHGRSEDMIRAASRALERAEESFPSSAVPGLLLLMDCASRALFLEDEFSRELEVMVASDLPVVGVCSLGEIANSRRDYLEFYNKTSVVAFLEGE